MLKRTTMMQTTWMTKRTTTRLTHATRSRHFVLKETISWKRERMQLREQWPTPQTVQMLSLGNTATLQYMGSATATRILHKNTKYLEHVIDLQKEKFNTYLHHNFRHGGIYPTLLFWREAGLATNSSINDKCNANKFIPEIYCPVWHKKTKWKHFGAWLRKYRMIQWLYTSRTSPFISYLVLMEDIQHA